MPARLSAEDIRRSRSAPTERLDLEFKIAPPENEQGRKNLATHVCAMANSQGGHIIIGLADTVDPGTKQRNVQGISLDDRRIDSTIRSIRDSVNPRVNLDHYDVPAGEGHSVVVITVQKPVDGKLRFVDYVAYERVAGPQTVRMEEDEINAFYISRTKEWAERCARDMQSVVETALGELAIRIRGTGGTTIPADLLEEIINRIADPEMREELNLILKAHPALQFDGTEPRLVSFVSPQAVLFYAATRLKAKGVEVLSALMNEERWDDVLLGVAGLVDSQKLDSLVEQAITRRRPLLAIGCFLSRNVSPLDRTRSRVLNILEQTFRTHPDDCMKALCFKEFGSRILHDQDTYFRSEALRLISSTPPPSRVIRSLSRRLVVDVEKDPRISAQIAQVVAEGTVPGENRAEVLSALIDSLDKCNQYPSGERDLAAVRDAILVALAKHLSDPPSGWASSVIRVAISRTRDDYTVTVDDRQDGEGESRSVALTPEMDATIRRLEELLGSTAGIPA